MITPIIQVTNVAPTATREQMKTLFSFIGKIEELKLYPTEDISVPVKVCFVKFDNSTTAGVALHLTNTVFIDRALTIGPYSEPLIPEEGLALQISLQAVAGTLPSNSSSWPSNVVSKLQGIGVGQVISTVDPKLTALGLPQYPLLPANTDLSKIEEIRRTVYVGNMDSTVTAEQILNFFTQAGEVKYVRLAGEEGQPFRFAFVEFSDQRSIPKALAYNAVMFVGHQLKVTHANSAIVKPHAKPEAGSREMNDAMRKVKEAQSLISAAIDTGKRSRSRSRSRSRKRSSRSRSRKSPSRSRGSHSRRRSRSRGKRSRSRGRRSRSRKRSRSRSKPRTAKRSSRSRSRGRRSRSKGKRSRSRTRHNSRSRRKTPPRAYSRRKSRSTSRSRKRRSRSRTRKHRSRSVEKKKSASKSPSPPTLKKEVSPSSSPIKHEDKEITKPELTAESDKDSTSNAPQDSQPKIESNAPQDTKPKAESSSPPRKQSRSRSPSISKHKSGQRSSSPRKRSRSRSGSRHRQSSRTKKRKERDHSRERRSDRDRDRDRDSKKRYRDTKDRDHKDREEKADVKVKRDYDEEEKGYTSPGRREDTDRTVSPSPGKSAIDSSPSGKPGQITQEEEIPIKQERDSDDMDTSD